MDVFLTGGTGTIGSAILRRLLAEGKSVAALARSEASARWLADAGARPIPGDLANPEAWIATALGCRGIIHTGASFGPDMAGEERRLVSLLRRSVPELAEPPRLVYTGGIWVYPDSPQQPLSESSAFDPLPAFSHLGELTRSLLTIPRMGVAVIHPALVSAPGRGPLAEMAEAAVSGLPFATRATADTRWPLVDADDLADLYLRALASSQFRLSLIGAGVAGAAVSDIAACVEAACGAAVTIETLPVPDGDPRLDMAAGYGRSQVVSSVRAMRMLGWKPVYTTLEALVEVAVGPIPAAPRAAKPATAIAAPVASHAILALTADTDLQEAVSVPDDAALEHLDWAEDELPPVPLRARAIEADVEAAGPFETTGNDGGMADGTEATESATDLDAAPVPDLLREPDPDYPLTYPSEDFIAEDQDCDPALDVSDVSETKP